MYQNKIALTAKDILNKDFKIDTRGYRLKEVDQFLDIIIGDYEQFNNIISNLEKEKADLLAENMNLKQELRSAKMHAEIVENNTSDVGVSNMDLLKRISRLEKIVYGSRSEENDPKDDSEDE